jgi:hypothetical protein
MTRGSCLCGAATWSFAAELEHAHSCHCSMCRKVHGTAYGAYGLVPAKAFRWESGREHVHRYKSSDSGLRSFCTRCGSVVAGEEPDDGRIGIPLGSLEDGARVKLEAHIFVASRAPWHEITDALPQFQTWPAGYDFPVLPTPVRGATSRERVGGSCLCGRVAYDVALPLAGMRHCHCSRCRRARSAPHAAPFRFLSGKELLHTWKVPDAQFFAQTFCSSCGSPMPRVAPERDLVVIPGGSFDGDPGVRPSEHIFVGSRAPWFEITDSLPQRRERQ